MAIAISAINSHFQSKIKNDTFGIWPEDFLYSLDNFRDGKAAFRMGEYLKTMIDLIKLNKNKNDVLLISAEKYAEKYGKDKVRINI